MKTLGGIILAAGLSSRMGDYKPLMEIDGVSLIRRVYNEMHFAGADPIVVVTGYRHEDIEKHLSGLNVTFVHNPDYATTQQLDSLKLGIAELSGKCHRIMISPADVPLVETETIKRLTESGGDFVRPVYHGKAGHPVIFDSSLADYISGYNGEGGLRGAIESANILTVDVTVEDKGVTLDSDTPQDFETLLKWHNEGK
jgi:CTP:molybdopterin cytidylyltransferase MocA